MSNTGNPPPNNGNPPDETPDPPSMPASSASNPPTHVELITMIQNMLQTVLANPPPLPPAPPAPILPNNMVKFSDPN